MTLDTSHLETRPVQGGALVPVAVVGHVHVQLLNDSEQALLVDEIGGALTMIDIVHHEVHEGEMFHAEYLWETVANNASADLLLATGARYPHTVFNIQAGGSGYLYLYEQVTTTGDGTPVLSYNMKRYDLAASLTAVTHTPTVSGLGFQLVSRYLPGGTGPQTRLGGGVRTGTEWILKPNVKYLLRVTNKSGAAIALSVAVEYYEEAEP